MSSLRCFVLLSWILVLLVLSASVRSSEDAVNPVKSSGDEDEDDFLFMEKTLPPSPPYWTMPWRLLNQVRTVSTSQTVKFQCQAMGSPIPTIHWYKNGQEFTKDQRIGGFKLKPHIWSLIMESVVPSDNGNYTCVVKNDFGSLSHTYQLSVMERCSHRPVLQAGLPANQTVVRGSDVQFVCRVTGDPPPHIQWLRHITINGSTKGSDGAPYVRVLKTTGLNTTNPEMDVLTLKRVTAEDSGAYTCLAGNSMGYSHGSAWLTVVDERSPHRPVLQAGLPVNQTVVSGSDVQLVCRVTGDPPPHIQWLRHISVNGSGQGPDGLPYVQILKTSYLSTTDGEEDVLTLRSVTAEDSGEYTCSAGNSIGVSSHSAWLTVVHG